MNGGLAKKVAFAVALAVLLASLATSPGYHPALAQSPEVFSTLIPLRPVGVFGRYVVGFDENNYVAVVDIANLRVTRLASATALGIDPASARMVETASHFALYDDADIAVFDSSLRLVGRLSLEVPGAFAVLPSGRVVVWHGEVVALLEPPRYAVSMVFDAWEAMYRLLVTQDLSPAEWLSKAYGVELSSVVESMRQEIEKMASEIGANVTSFEWRAFHDVEAHTVSEARSKLNVTVAGATVFTNGTVVAAVNAVFTTVVEANATALTEDNRTVQLAARREFKAPRGLLISRTGGTVSALDYYEYVESAGAGAVVAYVYRPFTWKTVAPRVLVFMHEHGSIRESPVYIYTPVEEVVLAPVDDDIVFLRTRAGVVFIMRGGYSVWGFRAERIVDVGVEGGTLYFVYVSGGGVFEFGSVDSSGRVARLAIEVDAPVAGAHVAGDVVYVAAIAEGGLLNLRAYAVSAKSAKLRIAIVDRHGALATVESGRVTVVYGDYAMSFGFNASIVEFTVPVPSVVIVEAFVPYGYARETLNVTSTGTFERVVQARYVVDQLDELPPRVSGFEGFYADTLLVSDADIAKVMLPGARLLDAWGPYLVLVETGANLSHSVLRVYSADGSKLYSRSIPGYVDRVKIMYPYMVVRTGEALYVFDLVTGSTKATVRMFAEGFDVDASTDYLSAWTPVRVAVADLRTGAIQIFEPKVGSIVAAPVVRGTVYVHVGTNESTVVYQYNSITGGVVAVSVVSEGVTGFASDGYTKIVSFESYSVVFTPRYGFITVPLTGVESVVTLDDERAVPPYLGGTVALAVFSDAGARRLCAVSSTPRIIASVSWFSDLLVNRRYYAEVPRRDENARIVMLSDFLGVPRVVLSTTVSPLVVAVGEDVLAYSNGLVTFLVPMPRFIGRYSVTVRTFDVETGEPVDAEIRIAELDVVLRTVGGAYSFYLTKPGRAVLRVTAPHYEPVEARIEVTGVHAHIVLPVALTPKKYTVRVLVTTAEGEYVREGQVTVVKDGVPIGTIRVGERITVRAGNYTLMYSSPVHAPVVEDVTVEGDATVVLVTEQTHSRVRFLVIDETGRPVANATVLVEYDVETLEVVTDAKGYTEAVVLPVGVEARYLVSAKGMKQYAGAFNVTRRHDGTEIYVALRRITGSVTIIVRDEDGNPETATAVVKAPDGTTVMVVNVEGGVGVADLPLGDYIIEVSTMDRRAGSMFVSVTEDDLYPSVEIIVPRKEVPLLARIYPYVIAGVIAVVVLLILVKMFGITRKIRVKKVTVTSK